MYFAGDVTPGNYTWYPGNASYRHGVKTNLVCMDGHTEDTRKLPGISWRYLPWFNRKTF